MVPAKISLIGFQLKKENRDEMLKESELYYIYSKCILTMVLSLVLKKSYYVYQGSIGLLDHVIV